MRLAIISDIHEDIRALETILRQIRKEGYDRLACLGDISGAGLLMYPDPGCRNAGACLDLVRESCDIVIPGNHDMHVAERFPKYPIGFAYPKDWYRLDFQIREKVSGGQVWLHEDDLDPDYNEDSIEFLRSLPEYELIDAGHFRILLSHYIYPDLPGFLSRFRTHATEFEEHFSFMENHGCQVAFSGHFHPEGYTLTLPGRFSLNDFGSTPVVTIPVIFGVPPVTSQGQHSGYSIFDTTTKEARFCKVAV